MATFFQFRPLLICLALNLAQAAAPQSTFITTLIENAEAKIKKSPSAADGYSDLAFALTRRARETEDPRYWSRAEDAIKAALKLQPGNFDARKARVILRIEQGRFADAEEEGVALNKQTPDDNLLYGLLTDIALARGDYPKAEALTQRMLDLRQVNGPGLQRAAKVREAIGFPEGSVEFWISALRLASTSDVEERAYILTQLAGISRRLGKLDQVTSYTSDALGLEPDYPAALVEKARGFLDGEKSAEALAVLSIRLKQSEDLAARYWSAMAGESDAGQRFAAAARSAQGKPGNRDDLLMRYLAQHGQAAEAVRIGKAASLSSPNIETLDAYALALLASGDARAAKAAIDRALQPGVRDPQYYLDAAEIYRRAGDEEGAKDFWKKCVGVNGNSRYASIALARLTGGS